MTQRYPQGIDGSIRAEVKNLYRGVLADDPDAIERVLRTHPNYVGRPADRIRRDRFVLADAQVTVANERGHATWASLVEAVAARLAPDQGGPPEGVGTRAEYTMLDRFATGIAVAQGDARVRDEHVLLALLYENHGFTGSLAIWAGIDPDEAYEALARRGVTVPPRRPGTVPTPLAPPGPRVYYPVSDRSAVNAVHRERYPPGSRVIGFSYSRWKPGYCFLDAEDDIDLTEMVRGAVSDARLVDVVAMDEADAREAEASAAAGEAR